MRSTVILSLLLAACSGTGGKPTDDTGSGGSDDTGTYVEPAEDRDGDGFSPGPDCDDSNAAINPNAAADICNSVDDDCDGDIDEDPDLSWYLDADADGFGATGSASFVTCDPGSDAYATNQADCDDGDAEIFPGADEVCDGLDNDCDGGTDDDPSLYGSWYPDVDRDGYGDDDATATEGCQPDEDWVSAQGDCDDADPLVNPVGDETCNGVDDDCNDEIDEDASEWLEFHEDADGDGAGGDDYVYGCDAESAGGADNDWDCDDADPGAPVFVSVLGSSRGDGTLDRPYDSIQDAIDVASTCVSVEGGTYTEDVDFSGRSVTVESQEGSGSTTIRGTGRYPVVTVQSGESIVLRGFTLTGGGGYPNSGSSYYWDGSQYVYYYYTYEYGGALYLYYSTAELEDVVMTANTLQASYGYYAGANYYYGGSYGGALYVVGSDLTMTDVDITGNSAAYGSAMYDSGSSTVGTRVRIEENADESYTLYVGSSTQEWENLILDANTSTNGVSGFYVYYTDLTLTNTTLVGNDYGVYAYDSDVTVDSSIVYDNNYGLYDNDASLSSWIVAYNDVYGNTTDYTGVSDYTGLLGNISENPGFVDYTADGDADNDDLTLYAASPAVDAGNAASAHDDVDGTRNDMGAYGGPAGSW